MADPREHESKAGEDPSKDLNEHDNSAEAESAHQAPPEAAEEAVEDLARDLSDSAHELEDTLEAEAATFAATPSDTGEESGAEEEIEDADLDALIDDEADGEGDGDVEGDAAADEPTDEETRFHILRVLEAVLFSTAEPLELAALAKHVPGRKDLPALLNELKAQYAGRGVNLVQRDDRWCFRTAADLAGALKQEHVQTKRLSRAAVETLATIAYHQPVSRPEIETIRGVATARGTLDVLMEAGWIKPGKRREVPGRPLTWITTQAFLDHFGLEGLADLPGLEDLKAAGLLDARPAIATLDKLSEEPDESDEDGPEDVELL